MDVSRPRTMKAPMTARVACQWLKNTVRAFEPWLRIASLVRSISSWVSVTTPEAERVAAFADGSATAKTGTATERTARPLASFVLSMESTGGVSREVRCFGVRDLLPDAGSPDRRGSNPGRFRRVRQEATKKGPKTPDGHGLLRLSECFSPRGFLNERLTSRLRESSRLRRPCFFRRRP